MIRFLLLLSIILGLQPRHAAAQFGTTPDGSLRTLSVLEYTRLDVALDDVPFSDALDAFRQELNINLLPRYDESDELLGMNPDRRITLHARDAAAIDVLEMMIDQATLFASCTWQLRHGMVEIGPKRMLSRLPTSRTLPLRDLLLEPPYFASEPIPMKEWRELFDDHEMRGASLVNGNLERRYEPIQLLDQLIRVMSEVVEPGNWDFVLSKKPPMATGPENPHKPWHSANDRVAKIRAFRDGSVLITAPDFFIRQVAGYPAVRPPARRPAEPAEAGALFRVVGIGDAERSGSALSLGRAPVQPDATDDDTPSLISAASAGDEFRAQVHSLVQTERVSLALEHTSVREAFDTLSRAINIPILVRYDDDELGFGIDPDIRISVHLDDVSFLDALEFLISECEYGGIECSWQVRRGFIEVSSKARLSVPAARVVRLYYVRDLMLHIPDKGGLRLHPSIVGLERVDAVVKNIEPNAWDYGQIDYYDRDQQPLTPALGPGMPAAMSKPPRRDDFDTVYYREAPKPAIIRQWRDVLIVSAPNYIHRQIGEPYKN